MGEALRASGASGIRPTSLGRLVPENFLALLSKHLAHSLLELRLIIVAKRGE
jgi:hypothetical protein